MKRAKWISGGILTAVVTLLWPGPRAGAATELGGWQMAASAAVVHIEVYEPTIPIPASPQGDFSIGYSSATSESGTARATASYLWPGTTIGDGFDQLTSQPGTSYPVQVNSRYPATNSAPKKNQAQLTKGNGMSTYSDSQDTKASVTGLGIESKDANITKGIGKGLGQIGGALGGAGTGSGGSSDNSAEQNSGGLPIPGTSSLPLPTSVPTSLPTSLPTKAPKPPVKPPKGPVPVPDPLADLVSVKNMTSSAEALVGTTTATSSAVSGASEIDLLGGVVKFTNVQARSTIVSNGKTATSKGDVTIGGMSIAGHAVKFGHGGFSANDQKTAIPALPEQATSQLKKLGISFKSTPLKRGSHGAEGTFSGQAMVVTINTIPLRKKLDDPLNTVVQSLGKDAADQLAPLLQLRPKLVLNIGEADNDASAFPAYKVPPVKTPPTTGGGGAPPVSGPGGGNTGGLGGLGGGGGGGGAGTTTGGTTTGGGITTGGGGTSGGGSGRGSGTTSGPAPQATGLGLPALGTVPRLMILGALVVAGGIGWVLQTMGGAVLGGAGPCQYGLRKGIPNLRKF